MKGRILTILAAFSFWEVFLPVPYLCIMNVSNFSTNACYRREGIYSPVCHTEENTWDFSQIEDDTERQNAGRSYQKSHNLDWWGNCERKLDRKLNSFLNMILGKIKEQGHIPWAFVQVIGKTKGKKKVLLEQNSLQYHTCCTVCVTTVGGSESYRIHHWAQTSKVPQN